jgi:hypothetical protein
LYALGIPVMQVRGVSIFSTWDLVVDFANGYVKSPSVTLSPGKQAEQDLK